MWNRKPIRQGKVRRRGGAAARARASGDARPTAANFFERLFGIKRQPAPPPPPPPSRKRGTTQ